MFSVRKIAALKKSFPAVDLLEYLQSTDDVALGLTWHTAGIRPKLYYVSGGQVRHRICRSNGAATK